jgi:hypothetical protein
VWTHTEYPTRAEQHLLKTDTEGLTRVEGESTLKSRFGIGNIGGGSSWNFTIISSLLNSYFHSYRPFMNNIQYFQNLLRRFSFLHFFSRLFDLSPNSRCTPAGSVTSQSVPRHTSEKSLEYTFSCMYIFWRSKTPYYEYFDMYRIIVDFDVPNTVGYDS